MWLASLNDADAGDAPPDPDEAYSKGYRLWSSSACKAKGYDPMCLLSLPPKVNSTELG